jgi:anti-anti-sigma factor
MTTCCERTSVMASVNQDSCLVVRTRPDRDRVIVGVSGDLDIAGVGTLQETLDELRSTGWSHIVLDLRELTFIDSSGLAVLLHAERLARRADATFAIIDGSPALARLLQIVGLEHHFSRAAVR